MISLTPTGRIALTGFVALVFAMGVGRFAFTPLLPMMLTEGQVSIADGGLLASVHFLGYAMGAMLAVYLRSSPGTELFASLVAIGVATLAMAVTESFAVWMLARWIAGLCSAFVLIVVSNHIVQQLAKARQTGLQGWVFAGVGSGIALVGLLTLGLMTSGLSSRIGWQICGAATLAAAAMLSLLHVQLQPSRSQPGHQSATRSPLDWTRIVPYGAMGAGYIIPATYLPVMAQQAVSSPLMFGWSWPVFGTAAAVSTLIAARLGRRMSNREVWMTSQLVMATGLMLPALWPHIATVVLAGICVGGTFMVITMAGMKEAHRIAGDGGARRLIAAMTAAFAFGQMVAPVLAGWVYESTNSFSYPLILASILLIATAVPLARRTAEACET